MYGVTMTIALGAGYHGCWASRPGSRRPRQTRMRRRGRKDCVYDLLDDEKGRGGGSSYERGAAADYEEGTEIENLGEFVGHTMEVASWCEP